MVGLGVPTHGDEGFFLFIVVCFAWQIKVGHAFGLLVKCINMGLNYTWI